MSVDYIPTLEELRAFKKSELVEDFFIESGDDPTGGRSFIAFMVFKKLINPKKKKLAFKILQSWHTLAFCITLFAFITAGIMDKDLWALAFAPPYLLFWAGNYMKWRKLKKGSNPNRKKGMSLAEFLVRTHTEHKGWEVDIVEGVLWVGRSDLLMGLRKRRSEFVSTNERGEYLNDRFWQWLRNHW